MNPPNGSLGIAQVLSSRCATRIPGIQKFAKSAVGRKDLNDPHSAVWGIRFSAVGPLPPESLCASTLGSESDG